MNCDHRIDDPIVSRWHCVFSERDGHIWLVDLGSKNGTRLNGELVAEPRTLADGDTLAIAYYTYLVCLGEIPLEVPFDQCTVPRQQESSIRS
jgi:pSer/pThr/pTyr-binding forkhead associated (FHA) protein